MHMSVTREVTHVICKYCDYHPITIQDVAVVVTAAGQDVSLIINLKVPYSNSIPIVLFKLALRLQLLGCIS